jgi:hypothetical protein
LFDVDLGASVRAQNSLLVAYDAVQEDRTTWALADFAWADSAADRSWQNTAASNIDVRFQLSKEEGLRSDEVYGWRLDDSLDGYGSPTIDDQDGVTYDEGRYGNGVNVTDVTKVSWTVTVPSVFSTYFWFIPNSVETSVIWSAEGSGIGLAVGYDALAEEFFLEDHLGQVVSVPFVIAADDRIFIGISQSTTDRRLYIGKMGGSNASQSESFASAGSYTSLRLY